ncbi:non-ribosomal peptide synthetase [Chitinophaga nivalis]|uniref:Amino acid adenylation domain-containing protein n=1 Tax=Chitinophaga nivalis TaxID=2991709 RepID=A0ABT3IKA6_9BACT|nr:non-ribosomal peptide synthetase [Chitinophaga nivalis]MCW3465953.1 amino acid adenylation domain-containing protein [Chitinophaga nivalis]MCW3484356.1 amino acid adenylation domain-containing protein [Chitinophaga nivalis]
MKDVLSILSSLKSKGLAIDVDDTGLNIRLNGPLSALTASDKAQLKDHKAAILDFIKAERKKKQQQATGNIPRIADQPLYVLSNAQRRLWVLSQFEEGNIAYNIPGIHVFEGTLNNAALETAFQQLLQRHESLRTVFVQDEAGIVWQQVLAPEATGFQVEYQDLQGVPEAEQPLKSLLQGFCTRPFDLAAGPLLRVAVFRIAAQKWVCCYVLHHIISDGWSMGILLQELFRYYAVHLAGEALPQTPLSIQYRDYAAWQQALLAGDALQTHRAYWLEQFSGALPVLDLPLDFPRSAIKTYNGGLVTHIIAPDSCQGMLQLCREQGATLFMGLLAVLNSLLHRYTQQEDIIIGTPIAGREQAELEDQIGLYLNTLALRTQFSGDDTFLQLLQQIRQITLAAYDHQAYPFDELVEALPLQREMSRSALFDVMLILQNHAAGHTPDPAQTGGLQVSEYNGMEHLSSKFDLSFNFLETTSGALQMAIEYNRDLFGESTIARIAACFMQLLTAAIHQPDTAVNRLPVLNDATIQQLLTGYNDTAADFPADRSIVSLFEEQVQATPDKTSLIFEDIQLTYRELNEQANRLARFLQTTYGVESGMLVGIQCARSEWLMITILGILKAGGAYVPVDMAYPAQRIAHIVADSQCKVLVNEEVLAAFKAVSHAYTPDNLQVDIAADQLAYVIYTSGSTGQPKGVMVEQRSVVRLVKGANYYHFTGDEIWLATCAVAFDVTTFEYWGALLHGGSLVFCTQEVLLDTTQLAAVLEEQQISIVWFTAGWLHQLIEEDLEMFRGLKTILAGGDKLSPDHINALHARYPDLEIINGYGPTENTTFSSAYRITGALSDIPIGKPISNSTVYILDPLQQLSLPGAIGEICVGGYGLSRGYLNNPALTAEKFVANPLVPGTLMYKTGDLGRWLPDGNIAFAGRKDDQVKIRGFRIEPGEIENALLAYAPVETAIVVVHTDAAGEKQLVAYITGKDQLDITALRAALGQTLPGYMIPAYFMQLEQLPLTPNGKTDRRNLPDPVGTAVLSAVTYIAPRNTTEKRLAVIWEEVLGRTEIGAKDNFFDLGGHSLKATRLAGRIYQAFEVKLALKELIINPVLEQQAALIRKGLKTAYIAIPKAPEQTYYPLSSAQKRLFFLHEFAPGSTSYNMPLVNYLGKTADKERIATVLQQLINRHESFRTAFVKIDGIAMQQIHATVPFELEAHQCEATDFAAYLDAYIRPFDISQAPLMRSSLVEVKGLGYVWVVDTHHLISDGTSRQVLAEDFMQLYGNQSLPELRLQYRDFSTWQNELLESGELKAQETYWLSQFSKGIAKLNFPADRPRPAAFTFEGDVYTFTLDASLTTQVRRFGIQHQGTLQMTLLAVLNVLLHRYTGQDDLLIGCGIAGRRHPELERIVGMFVNTLAIRNYPHAEQHFAAFYKEVADACIAAYENQDVQFEDLVDMLKLERDPSANPIFDVALVVQNFVETTGDTSVLSVPVPEDNRDILSQWNGTRTTKFDMSWFVTERSEDIVINLEYYAAIYDRTSIERLAAHFIEVLKTVLAQPDIFLSGISLLTPTAAEALLADYVRGERQDVSDHATFHEIFEKQRAVSSENTAVTDKTTSLTYQALGQRADELAHFLVHSAGLQQGQRVGVLQSRNAALPVSILAILKAGGVYVPLDANYPEERLLYMLEDAAIHILLTEKDRIEFANRLQWRGKGIQQLVCVDSADIYQERGLWRNDLMRKDLWDHVGSTATDAISQGGWMSSYTGEYLSEREMQEYSENAYLKLKDYLHPAMRVLEIGCSSGLTMFQIAPYVGAYHGTDLSSVILENTANAVTEKGYTHITLSCMPAHEIDQLTDEGFDLVIINSVIQSFDGHNYLRGVLEKAIGKMKNTGWLFIGDIMDEDRRQALIDDLTAFKRSHEGAGVRTKTDLSAELFVSKDYLDDLIRDNIGIADIHYSDKIYTIANELTDFRYDALLHINKERPLTRNGKHRYQHDLRHIGAHEGKVLRTNVSNTDLAYIIYTSGSTGKPKGVMVAHENIVSFLEKCRKTFRPDGTLVMPVLASHAFDISLFELFLPLLAGGTAMLIHEDDVKDIPYLITQLQQVTAFHTVPALMSQVTGYITETGIKEKYPAIKELFVGGDAVPTSVLEAMRDVFPQAHIHVLYGPTESTIFVTANHYESGATTPFRGTLIGKPNAGTEVYILDEYQQLVPVGVIGEICLGGNIVSQGYLNQPALTAEKFVSNPFNKTTRLYKTGDLGRWLADGNIEFAGRKDAQVKIRGYRIELEEIEHALQRHPEIAASVVIARTNTAGEKELVAYIVSKTELNIADMRAHLGKSLPDYMLPTHYVPLMALPLTPNGKVDRRNLPDPAEMSLATGAAYIPPRNETEAKLVQIWQEILGREGISVKDHFFERGGHSLKATRLSSQIHKVFDVKVALNELFSRVILEDQALLIAAALKTTFTTIPVADPQPAYVLSSSQRRLWVLSQFTAGNIAYNMPGVQVFEGNLDREALEASFAALIARHENLRTVFREADEVYQLILPATDIRFRVGYEDLRQEKEQDTVVKQRVAAAVAQPFDLAAGPLLRADLYQVTDHTWVFSYVIHHIISDGWSMEVLIRELLQLYNGFVKGMPVALPPLRIQYKDYAAWQQAQLKDETVNAHRNYWLTQFAGPLPVLELLADKPRPAVRTFNGAMIDWQIPASLSKGLLALSHGQGATLFMGLLALVKALLYRYTGQEDIITGTPIAGREHADLENQIGVYINTLALRTRFSGANSFETLLSHIKTVTLQAYEHQAYPFDELVDELPLKRDMSRSALFDVMVALQNAKMNEGTVLRLDGLQVSAYAEEVAAGSMFDLIFNFIEEGEEIRANIQYNTDIYTTSAIERLTRHLSQLLVAVIAQPAAPLQQLDYLSAAEKDTLLTGFNDTATAEGPHPTLLQMFAEQVQQTPDNIALVWEDTSLTYKALDETSNQLANYLKQQYHIQAEERVGIMLHRSAALMVGILGVLKSGGVYVPVDPEHPAGRKAFITSDAGIKVLITETAAAVDAAYYAGPVLDITAALAASAHDTAAPELGVQADNLAYIIYTSGSTGTPKGVMIAHGSIISFLEKCRKTFRPDSTMVMPVLASHAFDISLFEMFLPLLAGGTARMIAEENVKDIPYLAAQLQSVTAFHAVPALMSQITGHITETGTQESYTAIKALFVGGDVVPTSVLEAMRDVFPQAAIHVLYGPTESTIFVTTRHYESETNTPFRGTFIGKPNAGVKVYILDAYRQLVPTGVTGEIYVGGTILAQGYLNQPVLTAEKFIPNPFNTAERLYSTGDLGRWQADGSIEFAGRKDAQVKIRGYRIELGEIEHALQQHPAITDTVVIAWPNATGEKELVAYIVGEADLHIAGLRAHLSKSLPDYMVPAHYVPLAALPLTPNGKVDRKNLPDPAEMSLATGTAYIPPRNETEAKLVLIWQEILGREIISVKDNFFDIGGHSLKATRLSGQIHKVFDVKLSLNELFSQVVLEDQATLITQAAKQTFITIPPAPVQTDYVLSSAQRRLWILSQFTEGNVAYNIPGVHVFEGDLNIAALEQAFKVLLERHEILRTVFKEDEQGELRQVVQSLAGINFQITQQDLRATAQSPEEQVRLDQLRPFDLAAGPLIRASLLQVADEKWIFSYVMHHIISDGWSMGILIRELLQVYNACLQGEELTWSPLRIQYKDYAVWLREQLSGAALQAHKDYWLTQFAGALPILDLPADKPRPAVKTYNGHVIHQFIPAAISQALKALCQEEGSTLFMGLLAAVNALLYRYTHQEDIIIGSTIAGREHADLEDQIGFYAHTLALRTRFKGDNSYRELLALVKALTLGAYEHQVYPFDELIDALDMPHDMSRHPLFDVTVVLQNTDTHIPGAAPTLQGLQTTGYEAAINLQSKFDLSFNFVETADAIQVSLIYNTDVYTEPTIQRLFRHLEQLLTAVTAAPDVPVNIVNYLNEAEKQELLVAFNETATVWPADKTIPALFAAQAQQTPDRIALVFEATTFTYKALDEKANQLAHYLQAQYAIQPGDFVGIMLDRSAQLILAILGVLKCGGVYVPVDPEYPAARKAFITKDTGVKVLITQTDYIFDLDYYEGPVFAIDVQLEEANGSVVAPVVDLHADHLAYVMYTSGSMGVPKGVMVPHRGVVRLVKPASFVDLTGYETLLSTGAVSFDATSFEYWGMLLNGGKLVLCRKEVLLDSRQLAATIQAHGVDMMWFTAGWLNELADRDIHLFAGLKTVLAGGDRLSPAHINALLQHHPHIRIVNGYGPTENTTFSLTYPVMTACEDVPVGKPIGNSTAYILDSQLQPVPIGVVGEICVGGAGLAQGYLNQPDLTAAKFIAHPFIAGERLYKTGDLGRWLPDGNIGFVGRQDAQVKIRGYRIELGEIESVLQQDAAVTSAVVVARSNRAGDKELVAYLVGKTTLHIAAIRAALGKHLPDYMVPGYFIQLEALPLTANGKVDRNNLPDPEGMDMHTGVPYIAPRNETEEKLVLVWKEILGREQISVKDNFFEIGGHSLKATRLSSQIHKVFDVKVSLNELFSLTVLEEQAVLIAQAVKDTFVTIPQVPEQNGYELSSSQRRLWVLGQFTAGNMAYNLPGVYVFEGDLNREAWEHAFYALLERHEILRTVFREDETGKLLQFILTIPEIGFRISYRDLRQETAREQLANTLVQNAFVQPFDLAAGPLLRAGLYQLTDQQWVFSYVMHHIISDGWSMGVLIKELLQLYNAFIKGETAVLPPLRIQYKDYAAWQQAQLSGAALQLHRDYWQQQFTAPLPILDLPVDKPRPAIKTYNGGAIHGVINAAASQGLKALCQEQGSTLFMGLLAIVNTLFYRYTRQEDMVIGSPIAGREHADLEDQIGFYVNTLALRTRFKGGNSYRELLELVKALTLDAYEHQVFPFDELVDVLDIPYDMSRNPLFDVTVALQNTSMDTHKPGEAQTLGALQVSSYIESVSPQSKFDLSFDFEETGATIRTTLVYNTDIYTKDTMARLFRHLEQLLAAVTATPDIPIDTIRYLSQEEEQELLVAFNKTTMAYPADKTIPALFAAQARKTPDRTALVFEDTTFTYNALDEKTNQLAHYLRAQYAIQPGDFVGIMLDRSADLIITILGVLKCGGVYVPVDPEYPAARKAFITNDTGIKVLITQAAYMADLDYYEGPVFAISAQPEDAAGSVDAPDLDLQADHLAYVMYTSGSMGVPKGVMVPHRAVVRLVKPASFVALTGHETLLSTGAVSFDATSFEYWSMLLNGGKLVLCSKEVLLDSGQLSAAIQEHGVDMMWFTAGWLNELVDRDVSLFRGLKTVLAGGDRLSPAHINALLHHHPGISIINGYGPTENTTFSLTYPVMTACEEVPVGKPIGNSTVYILDNRQQPVPIGVVGEICVGGAGLAQGYLNQPDLTAAKFIAHPFISGERLYKTGDLGKWLPDGNIGFIGRQDAQVKIRGYRIELGEIESVLQSDATVTSAVVVARSNRAGDKELVAYLVGKTALNILAIRAVLSKHLPDYMVPGYFIQLEALPLTANGKVDRNNLPDPEGAGMETGVDYVAPRNETEAQLLLIWQEILGREKIGVKDNFFEIGGHSLKATRMVMQVKKTFKTAIELKNIFQEPTIEMLADKINNDIWLQTAVVAEDDDYEEIKI